MLKTYRAMVCVLFQVPLFSSLSRIYALPSFTGQLSAGDKERLDGLSRTAFIVDFAVTS